MAAKQNTTLANKQETLYCSSEGRAGESLREGAVHTDAVTGLMRPVPNCHMLLGGGHIMPVPQDFFLHPHTGRVMAIHGNVAYDPACSALVCTTDLCRGKPGKTLVQMYCTAHSRFDAFCIKHCMQNTIRGYSLRGITSHSSVHPALLLKPKICIWFSFVSCVGVISMIAKNKQ